MMTLQQQTRIAVLITVDNGPDNLQRLIDVITTLIQMLITFGQFVAEAVLLVGDIVEAVIFTAKVWSIWVSAFNYGLFGASVKV
ncbi:MAG: hypothetical protein KDJ97_35200 [Anaerolineae bacterium]|nr:hypothetical protein [Anaerolineae bacterium]